MDFKNLNWADQMIDDLINQAKKESGISEEEWNTKTVGKENKIIEVFVETFSETFPKFIRERRIIEMNESIVHFQDELRKDYKSAFEHLDTFSFLFSHFAIEYFKSSEIEDKGMLRSFILQRMFFRGIQVSSEIFHLLKGGFPNGALARWRSLHEITVVFIFLKNGNDKLLEMYNEYQIVEKYRRTKSLMEHHAALKWPSPNETLDELKLQIDELKLKYGNEFVSEYGWTSTILPKGKRKISGIEEFVQLNYLRSFYSYASDDIHAGMTGLQKDYEIGYEKYVSSWGGRSMFGYIDPVQLTVSTLYTLFYHLVSDVDTLGNNIL